MLTVLAPFFTLSIWAAWSGTSGNLSPTFTFRVLSWAAATARTRHRAVAEAASRVTERNMVGLLGTAVERGHHGQGPGTPVPGRGPLSSRAGVAARAGAAGFRPAGVDDTRTGS